jgi:hypothetical protein
MSDEQWRFATHLAQQRVEPVDEVRHIHPRERRGLAQARDVGHDDAMALRQRLNHLRPVDTAALDAAVQQ